MTEYPIMYFSDADIRHVISTSRGGCPKFFKMMKAAQLSVNDNHHEILRWIAQAGNLDLMTLIWPQVNTETLDDDRLLRSACSHSDLLKFVLSQGVCPLSHHSKALEEASSLGDATNVELLLQAGATVSEDMIIAAIKRDHLAVIHLLLRYNQEPLTSALTYLEAIGGAQRVGDPVRRQRENQQLNEYSIEIMGHTNRLSRSRL